MSLSTSGLRRGRRQLRSTLGGTAVAVVAAVATALGIALSAAAPGIAAEPWPEQTLDFDVRAVDTLASSTRRLPMEGVVDPVSDSLVVAATSENDGSELLVRSLSTGAERHIPIGGTNGAIAAAVSPSGRTAYVINNDIFAPSVSVVDLSADYTAAAPPPRVALEAAGPTQIIVGEHGTVYVLHDFEGKISVLTPGGEGILVPNRTISFASANAGLMALDEARHRMYVASGLEQALFVVDLTAQENGLVSRIALPNTPRAIEFDRNTDTLLVTFADTGELQRLRIDAEASAVSVEERFALAALPGGATFSDPKRISVLPTGQILVFTQVYPGSISSQVSVISPASDAPTRLITVPSGAAMVTDSRAGGTAYIPNWARSITVLTEVTLSTPGDAAVYRVPGSVVHAQVTRADDRPFTGGVRFDGGAAVAVDASGRAETAVGDREVGNYAFTASLTIPGSATPLRAKGSLEVRQAATHVNVKLPRASVPQDALGSVQLTVGTVRLPGGPTAQLRVPGTVTLQDEEGATIASAKITDGVAELRLEGLDVGTHQLTAKYAGSTNFMASEADPVSLEVTAPLVPQASLTVSKAPIGGKTTLQLRDFAPGDKIRVELHSDPLLLGEVVADESGAATLEVTIPRVQVGKHEVVAIGESGRTTRTELMVTPAETGPVTGGGTGAGHAPGGGTQPQLSATGAEASLGLVAGGLLALGGTAVLLLRRVRRQTR